MGDGGYNVGEFPALWSEWNGKYRDTMRDFWRGEPSTLGELLPAFPAPLTYISTRDVAPMASINFITAHDGLP